jgi:hypothetical protein
LSQITKKITKYQTSAKITKSGAKSPDLATLVLVVIYRESLMLEEIPLGSSKTGRQ